MLRRNLLVLSILMAFMLVVSACGSKQSTDLDATPIDEPPVEEPDMDEPEEGGNDDDQIKALPMPVLEDVYFEYDKHALSSDAKRVLSTNAQQLKSAASITITIEGHCDERGTNAYNLALGEKRAQAARDYLKSLGVSTSIKTVSYGEERPFAKGGSESAWVKNRRAHFVINS